MCLFQLETKDLLFMVCILKGIHYLLCIVRLKNANTLKHLCNVFFYVLICTVTNHRYYILMSTQWNHKMTLS